MSERGAQSSFALDRGRSGAHDAFTAPSGPREGRRGAPRDGSTKGPLDAMVGGHTRAVAVRDDVSLGTGVTRYVVTSLSQ